MIKADKIFLVDKLMMIPEANKLVDDFLGSLHRPYHTIRPDEMNYDSSFDWLMKAVHKIGEIENQADSEFVKELDEFKNSKPVTIFNVSIFAPINLIFECVIDFVKWFKTKQ